MGEMNWTAVLTGVAAIATAISAGFVGWQAWETRKTASTAARELAVGRDSLEVSQHLAFEAVKARLDSRGPVLRVYVVSPDEVRAPSAYGEPQPWPTGRQFRRPKDDSHRFIIGCTVAIHNEGTASASITASNFVLPNNTGRTPPALGIPLTLKPGDQISLLLQDSRPLAEWVENWEAWSSGQQGPYATFGEINCNDGFDEGVTDHWRVQLAGYPVEPITGEGDGWMVRAGTTTQDIITGQPPTTSAHVEPQQRKYFVSKMRNSALPLTPDPGATS